MSTLRTRKTATAGSRPKALAPRKSPTKTSARARPAAPVTEAPAPPRKAEAADKPRKVKMVRDSFTIPKTEYAAIDALKLRATQAGRPAKKSELLRAGLMVLTGLDTPAFLAALQAVPQLKTGRPPKG